MSKTILPTLYKKSSEGALLIWMIGVEGATIVTVHGQDGGALQTSMDTVKEGKNPGKKNETTPEQQAQKEAEAKWTKQKKKGYVEDKEAAQEGKVDEGLIQGGIWPMLSLSKSHPSDPILDKYIKKWPWMEQPKLDGVRCIAMIDQGKVTLWSRTRKPRLSMPHIVAELERLFPGETLILDGELYNHEYRDRFEDLVSIIEKDYPDAEGLHKVVQLHVYDLPNDEHDCIAYDTPYKDRYRRYQKILRDEHGELRSQIVLPVDGIICENKAELLFCYENRIAPTPDAGYEGSMAKNLEAPYQGGKRSHDILKMKEFLEGEMIILEILDGRGKDAGVCSKVRGRFTAPNGKSVIVEPSVKCGYKKKREYWDRREELIGKKATIKYKRLTADGVPYIPSVIWKAVRDYE